SECPHVPLLRAGPQHRLINALPKSGIVLKKRNTWNADNDFEESLSWGKRKETDAACAVPLTGPSRVTDRAGARIPRTARPDTGTWVETAGLPSCRPSGGPRRRPA